MKVTVPTTTNGVSNSLSFSLKPTQKITTLLVVLLSLIGWSLPGQSGLWEPIPEGIQARRAQQKVMPDLPDLEDKTLYRLSVSKMTRLANTAPLETELNGQLSSTVVSLPMPDGSQQRFRVMESPIMEPGLAAKFPEIKTYILRGFDQPGLNGRMMVSPYEFSAFLSAPQLQTEIIIRQVYAKDATTYVSYRGADDPFRYQEWQCPRDEADVDPRRSVLERSRANLRSTYTSGNILRIFRLAITWPGHLSEFYGYTTKAEVLAAITAFQIQINTVYERDLSVRYVFPDNMDKIIFLDDATDPFYTNGGDLSIYENQAVQRELIGTENYDVGFIYVDGGCCGARGQACGEEKEVSMNQFQNLQVTCHELGHQLSASHPWAHCGNPGTGNEIGGGTSIMAYPYICGDNNIPYEGSITFFSAYSREQMLSYIDQTATCAQTLNTGNTAPVVSVPTSGFTIPQGTPYQLVGSATDSEGGFLTYSWEQADVVFGGDPISTVPTTGNVPLQRHFNPSTNPVRIVPSLPLILNGVDSDYERLPTYSREMNYDLYVRDNQAGAGGTAVARLTFDVDGNAGPFTVTSQSACGILSANSAQTITWNVANTDQAPVSVSQVNILLSEDGGYTWPHTLASTTANDGSEQITLPANICTDQARIKVEAVGNIFFAVNSEDFSIDDGSSNIDIPSAVLLDGIDDAVEVSNTTVGNFGTGDFTIEMQFRTRTPGSVLASKRSSPFSGDKAWELQLNDNGFLEMRLIGGGIINTIGNTNLADGLWHHVAVTRASNTVTLYVDGNSETAGNNPQDISNDAPIRIGYASGGYADPFGNLDLSFKGEITEFRYWSLARAEIDISDKQACRLVGNEPGLEIYYPMIHTTCGGCSDVSASGILDATSNGNHGYLVNGAQIVLSTADVTECPTCPNGAITLTGNPANQNVADEAQASFSVTATGNNLSFQWAVSTDGGATFNMIPGATGQSYSLTAVSTDNGNQYKCYIANGCDVVESAAASLTVACPTLTLSTLTGETAPCQQGYFSYYVTPNPEVQSWEWTMPADWDTVALYDNMVVIRPGNSGGNITVTATDACGNMDTKSLAVNPVLVAINSQPANTTVTEGNDASFTVGISNGTGNATYQWQSSTDGGMSFQNLGTNAATLDIVQASISRDGELFRCIVEDESCLLDTTNVAVLTVSCISSAPLNENRIEGPSFICGSSTITYTINPMPGATSYNWSLPNGWTGSSTTNTIVVTTNGNGGNLSVTGTNGCGSSDPSEQIITASASCPGAIHLDGDDDYLTAAQNGLYLDGDMTVSFWVKPDRITGVQSLVNNGSEFEIALINGQVTYRHTIYGGGYTSGVDSTFNHTQLATGSWHHVSIVRDVSESSFSLYLNGQLFETKAWSSAYPDTPRDNDDYPLTLGAGVGALHTFFKGALDDIQIWEEARSASQVLEDVYCNPSGSEPNLVGFFGFDQGTSNGDNTGISSFTNDASGFGNATPNNLALTGNNSNIVDGTKVGGSLTGPDFFCSTGDQLTFTTDFPGTPTVTWTLPNGWAGTSTSESITVTAGATGGYVRASATLNCGTVELLKFVSDESPTPPATVLGGVGLDFSGSDDYVSVPSGNINFQNEPLTIEFWAKMPNTSGFEFFVSQGDDSENNHLLIGAVNSDVYFDFRDPSGLQATGALDTEWHHWAFVYDPAIVGPADNRFIYKDGVEVAGDNFAGTIDISGAFKIGDHFGNGFEGQIDEFRLWKTARSVTEIQANIYCPIECINDDIRLYLPFEDGIANGNNTGFSTTEDFSPNDFTANLVGFDLQNPASNFTTGLDLVFYEDADGDGFGSNTLWTCASAFAKVDNNLDCDDTKPFVNPLSDEICDNGADDNCNGVTDESDLALNFTGTNDSLNLGTTLGNWGTNPFTLEARIKTTKTNQFIFSKRPVCNSNPPFWNIKISNDGYLNNEFISPGASNTSITYASGNLADGTWHHIAITRDANNDVRYYLDGALIQINGQDFYFQNSDITNTDPLYVGPNICSEQFEGGGLNFEGDIDQIRIWNIARSATDIDTYKDRSIPATVSGLEAYYDFNNPNATGGGNNAGQTTVTDRTGNHPGTLTGFALSGTASNWIDGEQVCDPCTVTASLTNDGPVCDGELLTFTATPGGETTYLFFQDKNGNGAYDMANNELLQNNGSNTFASDTLSNGLQIGVLINDCALAYSDPVTIPDPTLIITDPAAVESPNTVDLTDPAITAGSDAGTFTYFTDAGLTNSVPDETMVGAGTYYILLTDANGCIASGPVTVTVNQPADNTPPSITSILRQVPLDATTDADQVTFRITFSEDVQNVTAADFTLSGTAAGDGSIGTPATVSADVYDITITGLTSSNGTINLDIANGNDIEDLANNALGNSPSIGSEEEYTMENSTVDYCEVTTFAGSGATGTIDATGLAASFDYLIGSDYDAAGNLYVVEFSSHLIRKITPDSVVTTFAGSGSTGSADGQGTAASFNFPNDLAVNSQGEVFVADGNNGSIRKITPGGLVSTFVPSFTFAIPSSIAIDDMDNLYVCDLNFSNIYKVTPAGVVTTIAGSSSFGFTDGNGTSASFRDPYGLALDAQNNIYVADRGNHAIRKITPSGDVTTLAGTGTFGYVDGPGNTAQFYNPHGLIVGPDGNVYVADNDNSAIRKITPAGQVSTLAGGNSVGYLDGPINDARFFQPLDVLTDANGALVIIDTNNKRIRKIANCGSGNGDAIPPSITSILRQVPLDATTNADQVTFRITFSEDVQNVTAADFSLSGTAAGDGSIGTPATVSADVYDITITGLTSSNGTINLDVTAGNDVEDLNNNALGASPTIGSEETYTLDNISPTTVITSAESGTTGSSPFEVTITFSEAVTGFDVNDISVSNGAASNVQTSDNTVFTADITPVADGIVTVDVAGAVATDAAGNDNQAASQFSITYDSGGGNNPTGAALNFATTNPESWLQVEDDPLLNFNQEISIEFWCNPTSRSSYSQIVLKADAFNWSQGWGIYIDFSGQLIFHPTGWGNRINTAQNIPLNQWTHVSATYDGSRAKIYINGTLEYDQPHSGTINPTNDPMGIGVDPGYRSIRFTGTLDEVRVWDRAISQADVTANKDCEISGGAPNLVANYHFNQGEADGDNTSPAINTLIDDSGNGLNGTLNGFTLNGTTSNWTAPGGVTSGINCAGAPFVQSISRQVPLDATTDADQVTFRVSFSEDVSNVDGADFELSGTAAADGTVSNVATIDAGTYDVTITGLTSSEGTINLDFTAANNIQDTEMNALGANPPTISEEEYTISNIGPIPGSALAFAQSAGYITVPDDNSLDFTNAMTIETWVKRTGSNPNNFSALVWKTETNLTGGYALYTFQDRLEFFINGNQINNLGTGYTLPLDTWVHVAATYDGTFLKVFVNGSQVGSDVFASSPPPANNFPVGIGSDPRYDSYNFIGEMDEVRLWNRALTPTEIMANMNCEITGPYIGLAASYQFNQGIAGGDNTNPAVNTLVDASGNGNDGTLTGFTLNGTSSNWIETGGVTSGNECSLAPAILSIVRQNPTDATTIVSQVTFRVTFSEDVQNVDASDFALSGIAGLDGTISAPSIVDASTYDITVTGLGSSEGRLNLDVAAGNDISNSAATALGDDPLIGLEEEYYINNGCQNNLNVSTLAGLALQYGSDDGTGNGARFNFPNHVTVDGQGNVYVADGSNQVIRKVTPAGVVTTIAGQAGTNGHADGQGTDALFFNPQGITIDLSGNLYVSEGGNHTIRKISPSGAVTTLAGSPGNSGTTDGTGVDARFNGPSGIDFDGANTLYVTDQGNHTIRSINAFNGAVTTLAGQAGTSGFSDGTGSGATFTSPRDLVFATDGNLYVASESGGSTSTIRQVTSAGVVTTIATGSAQGVVNPNGITQGKDGLLYFTSANDNTISSLPLTGGNATVVAGSTPGSTDAIGTNAQFFVPFGIEADAFGNFYVADLVNSTIRKIGDCPINGLTASVVRQSPVAEITTATSVTFRLTFTEPVQELGTSDLFVSGSTRKSTISAVTMVGNDPAVYDVTVTDLDQAVGTATLGISPFAFINDFDDNRLSLPIPFTTQETYTLGGGQDCNEYGALDLFVGDEQEEGSVDGTGTDARMDARRLVVADDGTVYFTDFTYHVIKKISPAGEVTLIAGQSGVSGFTDGTGDAAQFYNPRGLALDDQGNLYIADSRNHAIRKITPAGVVTTLAGNGSNGYADGSGAAAQFAFPQDVTVDGNGDILVADGSNRVIRKVTQAGVTSTVAGTAGQSGTDDGTGAAARFNYPSGLLMADNGDVYITDRSNRNIRKMTSAAVVTTIAGQVGQSGTTDGVDGVGLLNFPYDMVFDPNGDLIVADFELLRKVTLDGTISTVVNQGRTFLFAGIGILGDELYFPERSAIYKLPICTPVVFTDCEQVGQTLEGDANLDLFGRVALSTDGNRMIVGASQNGSSQTESGYAKVYELINGQWTQMGSDLIGEAPTDYFGGAVAISGDGNRIAIGGYLNDALTSAGGHVRVFEWDGSDWQQMGPDLDDLGQAGVSVALSEDGSRLIYGANGFSTNRGKVVIKDWNGSAWVAAGSEIVGTDINGRIGTSVNITSDGQYIVIGGYAVDGFRTDGGEVRAYEWTGSDWSQVGSSIFGTSSDMELGFSVDIADGGTRLIAGVRNATGSGSFRLARVYDYDGSDWTLNKSFFNGTNTRYGDVVSMTPNGNRVAIFGDRSIQVFDWDGVNWAQVCNDFPRPANNSTFFSLNLSGNGERLGTGGYYGSVSQGPSKGFAEVFQLPELPAVMSDPITSIRRQDPMQTVTDADQVTFRVTFSESVQNVDAADFELSGTAAGDGSVGPVAMVNANDRIYDVTITGLTSSNGTINLDIASANDIQDAQSSPIGAAPAISYEEEYTLDNALVDGAALHFGGGFNNVVRVADDPKLDGTGGYSIELWVNPDNLDRNGWRSLINKSTNTWYDGYGVATYGETLYFYPVGWSNGTHVETGLLQAGQWTHLAFTYDGATSKIYQNGTLVSERTINRTVPTNNGQLTIGGGATGYSLYKGAMDELRIWNRALEPIEIQSYMNCEIPGGFASLVANYHFNEGVANDDNTNPAVDVLPDASGNSLNGSLINFTLNGNTANWIAPGGVVSGTECNLAFYVTSIERLNPDFQRTDADQVTFRVTFSEDVQNVDVTDFELSGTLTGTPALGVPNQISASVYEIDVTNLDEENGTLGLDIASANNISNLTSDPLGATPIVGIDETYIIDNIPPVVGAALSFDKSGQVVEVPNNASLNMTDAITVETWVYTEQYSSWDQLVMKANPGSWRGGFCLSTLNGYLDWDPLGWTGATSSYRLPLNTWTHVAGTYDGAVAKLYVNGQLISSTPMTGAIPTNTRVMSIGGDKPYGYWSLNGKMDEVRVWNRALSVNEILTYKDCEIQGAANGLVANYHFNQGIAEEDNSDPPVNTLLDDSGEGNEGFLIGFELMGSESNWIADGGVVSGVACNVSANPEMAVLGGSPLQVIFSGDNSPEEADGTDFGLQTTGTDTDRTFTIRNTGDGVLNLPGNPTVAFASNVSGFFSVETQPVASSINPGGGDLSFVIRYSPVTEGVHTATVSIESNDDDEDPYLFTVTGVANASAFITEWTISSDATVDDRTIRIPTFGGGYNYTVDWGDDNVETNVNGFIDHTYAAVGTYTVTISGEFPQFYMNGRHDTPYRNQFKLTKIKQWGDQQWRSMDRAFAGARNLEITATDAPDLSQMTNMLGMFQGTGDLGNPDLTGWNTSTITDMQNVFWKSAFNGDVSTWDVSNVTNMQGLFASSQFTGDISGWTTTSLQNANYLFSLSSFNGDLSNWNMSQVTSMIHMFSSNGAFNQDISMWNTGNVTNMAFMFYRAGSFNQPLNDWNVSSVTNFESMFKEATVFNQPLNEWELTSANRLIAMFASAPVFNQDISMWSTSGVTHMNGFLNNARSFDQDLGGLDITGLAPGGSLWPALSNTAMSLANYDATLIGWAAQNAPNGVQIGVHGLSYCAGFDARQDLVNNHGWVIVGDTYAPDACSQERPFITTWTTTVDDPTISIITDVRYNTYDFTIDWGDGMVENNVNGTIMHTYTDHSQPHEVKISGTFPAFATAGYSWPFDKENARQLATVKQWGDIGWESFRFMFTLAENMNITATDAPDLSKVTNMRGAFSNCRNLNADLNHWDVSKVTNMTWLFERTNSFNGDISRWDVSNVIDMRYMFSGASSFNQAIGSWDVSSVTNMTYMFLNAFSFDQNLGGWNLSSISGNGLIGMLNSAGLSTANYDATLIGWVNNPNTPDNLTPVGVDGLTYCAGEAAIATLQSNGWSFIGHSKDTACPSFAPDEEVEEEIFTFGNESPAAIATRQDVRLSLFPNPAQSEVTITVSGPEEANRRLLIFDPLGKLVWSQELEMESRLQLTLNQGTFPSGLYTVTLQSSDGILSQRLLITR